MSAVVMTTREKKSLKCRKDGDLQSKKVSEVLASLRIHYVWIGNKKSPVLNYSKIYRVQTIPSDQSEINWLGGK